jgi:hypothetical protein
LEVVERVLLEGEDFFCEVDDSELLFLANIELLDEFVMDFHEFFLEDGDFVFVVMNTAAGRFGFGIGFESLTSGGSEHRQRCGNFIDKF